MNKTNSHGGPGRGQGRKAKPKEEKLVYKQIGLSLAEWQRVQGIAKRNKISRNAALRLVLSRSELI